MAELERLKNARKAIRAATTKLLNGIEEKFKSKDNGDIDFLNERLQLITDKERELIDLNAKTEALLPVADIENDVTASLTYSENLSLWKLRVKNQIVKLKGAVISDVNDIKTPVNDIKTLKLPRVNIRTYFGDPAFWLEFIGQFESAIDKNPSITKIDKLIYLKSYLGGSAASSIAGLAITEQNYDAALKILKNRFGNTNTLIQTHMNGLLRIPAVHNSQDISGLRKIFDKIEAQIRNLEGLGIEIDSFSNLLMPIILDRIPRDLVLEFNRKYPLDYTFPDLLTFLENEIQSRERTFLVRPKLDSYKFKSESYNNETKSNFKKFNPIKRFDHSRPTGSYATSIKRNCVFCNSSDHEFCEYKTVEDRKNKLKSENRCFKCFAKNHHSRSCRLKFECKFCKSKYHNYLLCGYENVQNKVEMESENNASVGETDKNSVIMQCNSSVSKSNVLLLTCSVVASSADQSVSNKVVRVLLDNGSERSWCTKSLANSLKLKTIRKERLSVYSFGSVRATEKIYDVVKLKLINRNDSGKFIIIETLVTETITAAPIAVPDVELQNILKMRGLTLADESESKEQSINILVGGDMFWNIIQVQNSGFEKINKTLNCIPTIFGFTIQGVHQTCNNSSVNIVSSNLSVGTDVQVLWDLESLGIRDKEEISVNDKCLIERFENDLKFVDGRYETGLLWKNTPAELDSNFLLAKKRFNELQQCFLKNEWIANEYKQVIKDQESSGIIQECARDTNEYFMPHRCVLNINKETSKCRVVFNCSSKSKQNKSLNDCLETCPNLNPNILDVILNFRKFNIAFNGDIEKAFLMIGIAESDRKFLKFLWLPDDESEEYKIMQMNRLPFGCKISSFILSSTIKNHIKKYEKTKPNSVHMLDTSLYVDDLYFGAESVNEAFCLSSDAVSILAAGGFNLRKLRSNSRDLEALWEKNGLKVDNKVDCRSQLKVLGLNWYPEEDVLSLEVKSLVNNLGLVKNTKRSVLQIAAMIFDPIGICGPFVVRIKRLLQEIWEKGLSWDEELPSNLKEKWLSWCAEIEGLGEIKLQRYCFLGNIDHSSKEVELHVFCDASPNAYGIVAYFRYQDKSGSVRVSFIVSKNKVAPLKKLTLPRLELMAVLIGARVGKYIYSIFKESITRQVYWTDSEIVLHWIKGSASRWKQFVANRVLEIQEKTDPKSWFHCRSEDNPADLVTRGVSVGSLIANEKWFFGPGWLRENREFWPNQLSEQSVDINVVEKEAKAILVKSMVVKLSVVEELWSKFSSWSRLQRIVAWCFRFIRNVRKSKIMTPHLEVKELKQAHVIIIKAVQQSEFFDEIKQLKGQNCLSSSNKLSQLSPYLDEDGLLKVGGRLKNARLAEEAKHPIILPKIHPITNLIIIYHHLKYLHSGFQLTHSAIRQSYWIIGARSAIRRIISKCVVCIRHRSKLSQQFMADLPSQRVNQGRVFSITGTDFAGPFPVSYRRGRGVRPTKTYVCIFVCFITKAVHLEIVNDLSSDGFINALKRFIARRSKPLRLYSDCGTNFIGARNDLKMWASESVGRYLAEEGIEWRLNAPSAPHFGGLWEAAVKLMKHHMKRVIGSQILSYEQFSTYLAEIEAVMNSRPLIPLTDDPDELTALTPGHFIVGVELKRIPEPNVIDEKISLRDRLKIVTQLSQSFWKKWSKDYLTQLQIRNKWKTKFPNLKLNDLVLIKDDNLPPLKWRMGRIIKIYPGSDERVRIVTLKTVHGELKRPIHKLVLLLSEQ